jgi:DNA-binding response OmpR family regulator
MGILLVENHCDTAHYLGVHLEGRGHTVVIAETVGAARAAFSAHPFDLLISDISLPDGTGWDLMAERSSDSLYAVAMSGFGHESDRQRSLDAGFRHHLTKPFLPSEFDAIIREAEDSHSPLA